jgi:hypothetical protein
VRSGATAEVGRTGADFVSAVTKSGASEFHGEAFYLNRNPELTARDASQTNTLNLQYTITWSHRSASDVYGSR